MMRRVTTLAAVLLIVVYGVADSRAQALLPVTERGVALMRADMERRAAVAFVAGEYDEAAAFYGELTVRFGDRDGRYAFEAARCRARTADRRMPSGIFDSLRTAWPRARWRPHLELETGHMLFRGGKFHAALRAYLRADSLVPGLPDSAADDRIRFGYALMWGDSLARAVTSLAVLRDDSLLGDYAHFWLAECYGRMDSTERRMIELHRLVTRYPGSIHTAAARMEMAGFYFDAGYRKEALALYRDGDSFAIGDDERALVRYRSGILFGESGAHERADSAWLDAMRSYPASSWAWKSRIALINARSGRGMTLRGREQYDNAAVLAAHNQPAAAVREALAFIEANPAHPLHGDALYLAGTCRYRQHKYKHAAINFGRLRERFPAHELAGDALLYLARCDRKRRRTKDAEKGYRAFADGYPGHARADDVLWSIAWDRETRGALAAAASAYRALAVRLPHTRYGGEAAWRAGFCLLKNGDAAGAARAFSAVDTTMELYLQDQALYWRSVCARQLGDAPAADSLLRAASRRYPRTYYSVRAHEALHGTPAPVPDSLFRPALDGRAVMDEAYGGFWLQYGDSLSGGHRPGLPLARAMRLVQLYLVDEARDELVRIEERHGNDRGVLVELARVYYENGYAYRAYRVFRSLLDLTYGRDTDAFPLSAFHFLYPVRYLADVRRYASAHGSVDPFLALALMHQESRFNPLARSRVDARGLMQIMPATGREIAQRLGVKRFHADSLFIPALNIRFGTAYLAWQLDRFDGDVAHTLASYNGGATNVRRWLKRFHGSDPDTFIENIPFRETRKYVKIVYRNYHLYRFLWEDRLLEPVEREE